MSRGLLGDWLHFLRWNPLWWLLPPAIVLAILAALVFFTSGSNLSGLIYNV